SAIIEESAPTFRFSHMELRHGALARHLPPHIAGELHTARFCKLEYPIAQPLAKPNDFVTLNIWCTTETLKRPVGAERVARIIGPAISSWLEVARFPIPSTTSTPAIAAATATASNATTAVALPTAPAAIQQPERDRQRRPARPAQMNDGD